VIARFGTSGFSYKEWRGSFYPADLSPSDMLSAYAQRLPTVELNNSFYRMPRATQVQAWAAAVPDHFRFALKAPRRITHIKKLRDTADPVAALFRMTAEFRQRSGPTLFQLPPFLKRDLGLLRDFLTTVPAEVLAVLEFRHESWFCEDTYQVLADAQASLCGGDMDDTRKAPPLVKTSAFCYLRLRRSAYGPEDLADWERRLAHEGFDQVFGYFKHEELGPSLALAMNARF
jgi:uncharacterized protein YecE (DUF72 family)